MYLGIENASSADNAKAVTYGYNTFRTDECWEFIAVN